MAYDEDLAGRIRQLMAVEGQIVERKMFGGLAFLLDGHMTVAASGQGGLLARYDPEETDVLLAMEHVEPMVMRGREMDGWARVTPAGVESEAQLELWVRRGLDYARSLPPKLR